MRLPSLRRRAARPPQPKPLPFTEADIRERAYQLWQANPEGSAPSHWDGAIEALQRERSLLGRMGKSWQTAAHKDNRVFTLDVVKVLISGFGVLATVFAGVGLYLTYRTGQAQLESAQQERQLNSERLVTDRFAKAVEQLGSKEPDVRIGAIYSLERIARDSPRDHWTIMEVLTAFVRNQSKLPKNWKPCSKQEVPKVTIDVQSALTVIGRRRSENDPPGERLDLNSTNLRRVNLFGANLERADLNGADLTDANLNGADFNGADLNGANLDLADLEGANLRGAHLVFVGFRGTNLYLANLEGANLQIANLEGAELYGANLKKVKNITTAQIKAAQYWYADYDPDVRKALGLPPEKLQP